MKRFLTDFWELYYQWFTLFLILLLGAFLRFYNLGMLPFWIDETFTIRYTSLPFEDLIFQILDIHPPIYYIIQKIWNNLFGVDEYSVRSLSAVIGTLSIIITYVLGRNLFGRSGGLIAAALLATSAIHIQYSQEARAYALLIFATLLAATGMVEVMRHACSTQSPQISESRNTPRQGLGLYVVGTCLALYSHNTAVLLPLAVNLVVLVFWIGKLHLNRRFAVQWITANILVLVLWSWWLPVVLQQAEAVMTDFWLPSPTLDVGVDAGANILGQKYVYRFQPLIDVAWLGMTLLGASLVPRARAVLFVAIMVPLINFIVSQYIPIFMERTVVLSAPLIIVLVGGCIQFVGRVHHVLLAIVVCAALAIQGIGVRNYWQVAKKEQWPTIVSTIDSNGRFSDLILLCPALTEIPYRFYADRLGLTNPLLGIENISPPANRIYLTQPPVGRVETIRPSAVKGAVSTYNSIWLVRRGGCDSVMSESRLLGILEQSRQFHRSWTFETSKLDWYK